MKKYRTSQIKGQLNLFTLFKEKCSFLNEYYCTHYMGSHLRYIDLGEACDSLCCYGCKENDLCGYACNACKKIKLQTHYRSAPRHSWEYYGISKERYRQLTEYIQSSRYTTVARQAAHRTNKDISEYLLLSATENLSYDELQKMWELKKIERMACCRTDFYGYRRLFYHLFDLEVRRIGK